MAGSATFFAIEVGARGFNSTQVPFCLKSLGFPPKSVKALLGKLSRAALQATYHIWLARSDKEWKPPLAQWETSFGPKHPIPVKTQSSTTVKQSVGAKEPDFIDFVVSSLPSPKVGAIPHDQGSV